MGRVTVDQQRRPARSLAALLTAASVLMACGGDDDTDATDIGAAVADVQEEGSETTAPSNQGTARSTTSTTAEGEAEAEAPADLPDLPPPDTSVEASPPTTAPGTEADEWPIDPFSGESLPLIGDIVVDLEPNGHLDFPVALTEGQVLAVISAGDDGIMTHIEIFRPDGGSEGSWRGGEPEVINGWEWVSDGERIPATGTYVFRVIHLSGSDEPFLLRFFGQA